MNRIKELRREKGWMQSDLAKKLQTSRGTIGHYETGERVPDVETILKLCDIFDVTADYLLGRSEVRSFALSPEEAELLEGYRALSDSGKEYLRHTLALASLAHTEKSGALPGVEAAD